MAHRSFTHVPGAHAPWLDYEFRIMDPDVRAHPDFIAAMQRRGYTDLSFIDCGGGPPGYYGIPEYEGRRIASVTCYDARDVRNTWTRTIEGLTVVYDMGAREVLRVIDDGIVPVPATVADYDDASIGPRREPLPPITITQPLGPGFRVEGHNVTWQDWSFHLRPDFRTGMVVSTVRFRDGDELRPVLYEGHLSEIFVPYMDPATAWYTRNYLDLGEYITGGLAGTMEPGIDCPDYAVWFNQVIILDDGRPHDVPRVICLFERLTGDAIWRHGPDGRPARELVARMTAQLGNYDYIIDWVFRQDGSIRVTVGTTGIPAVKIVAATNADSAGDDDAFGRFVADNAVAISHERGARTTKVHSSNSASKNSRSLPSAERLSMPSAARQHVALGPRCTRVSDAPYHPQHRPDGQLAHCPAGSYSCVTPASARQAHATFA
jgi:primary-amine oxidase